MRGRQGAAAQVESLLAQHASRDGALDGDAVTAAARMVSDTAESSLTGRRIGAYEVLELAEKKISADRIKDGVVAQAHPVAGRASIFCHRIATAAGAANLFGISLGDVIGHEMGHLVLGTNSHSRSGIMRANMGVGAFRFRTFEQTQATTIRTSLLGLATSSARR
jgi:hypothetical protein